MLELPCPRRIQSEIGLQRDIHLDPLGYIDERATRPDRTMQRGELMRLRRHKRHEILLNDVTVLLQRRLHVRIHNALLHERLLNRVVDHLRVVLCANPCERRFLCLGNPQTVECILDVLGHLIPVPDHLRIGAHIGHDLIHIQLGEIRPPCGHWHRMVNIQ